MREAVGHTDDGQCTPRRAVTNVPGPSVSRLYSNSLPWVTLVAQPRTELRNVTVPLTRCIECGQTISDSARRCPHQECATAEPFGTICDLCGAVLRRSVGLTAVRYEPDWRYEHEGGSGYWWHPETPVAREIVTHHGCVERYFTLPRNVACLDCQLPLVEAGEQFAARKLWIASNQPNNILSFSRDEQWLHSLTAFNIGADYYPDCPRCGRPRALGITGACAVPDFWRPNPSWKGSPCTKPLYPFQVENNGQGHGHSLARILPW